MIFVWVDVLRSLPRSVPAFASASGEHMRPSGGLFWFLCKLVALRADETFSARSCDDIYASCPLARRAFLTMHCSLYSAMASADVYGSSLGCGAKRARSSLSMQYGPC